jgi:hypothetical protein
MLTTGEGHAYVVVDGWALDNRFPMPFREWQGAASDQRLTGVDSIVRKIRKCSYAVGQISALIPSSRHRQQGK